MRREVRRQAGEASISEHLILFVAALVLTVHCSLLTVHAQTGGTYDLSHSVIAGGGGSASTGGTFSVSATVGQEVAGVTTTGAPYNLQSGFWFRHPFAPTSASVPVIGRATTDNGHGIPNVLLVLTEPNGTRRIARTSAFGYYAFDDIPIGKAYILEVFSKGFIFVEPVRVFMLFDKLTDMDFIAFPE